MIGTSKTRVFVGTEPMVIEIEDVTAPRRVAQLADAVAALWLDMRSLPLGNTQYEAYRHFFTRPDAVERVTELIQRDGELNLSFRMDGRPHRVQIRPDKRQVTP